MVTKLQSLPDNLQTEAAYLLGWLAESEREVFRERVLADEAVFDRVREAEDELYDAYARGRLPDGARRDFEAFIRLDPGMHRKMVVAKRLSAPMAANKLLYKGWLAAAIVLVAMAIPFAWRQPPAPAPPAPAIVAVLRLQPATRAATEIPSLALPLTAGDVELRCPVVTPGTYRVDLKTARGAQVRSWVSVDISTELVLRVPSASLPAGAYELSLSEAGAPVAFHDFRIVPRL